jgi:hypothetical protein
VTNETRNFQAPKPATDEPPKSFLAEHATPIIGAIGLILAAIVAGIFALIEDGGDGPTPTPTGSSSATPTTAIDELQLGGLYYLFSPNDPVLVQVVDTNRQDPRLRPRDAEHPTAPWDPKANWVDLGGYPVSNPLKTLGPEAVAVSAAFGTPENLAAYIRENLKPL